MADKKQRDGKYGGKINIGGTNANAGRPRKLVGSIILEMQLNGIEQVKSTQVVDVFELLMNLTKSELTALSKDAHIPIIVSISAGKMISDSGFEAISAMIDRAHGKPRNSIDHTTKGLPMQTDFKIEIMGNVAENPEPQESDDNE